MATTGKQISQVPGVIWGTDRASDEGAPYYDLQQFILAVNLFMVEGSEEKAKTTISNALMKFKGDLKIAEQFKEVKNFTLEHCTQNQTKISALEER